MVKREAVEAVCERALKIKASETCLIITDSVQEYLARPFYEYLVAKNIACQLEVIPLLKQHAEEPAPAIARVMREKNVVLLITEKSLSHTQARRNACAAGARIASMPMLLLETANRCLDVDYEAIQERSQRLAARLQKGARIHVTTARGTDIMFERGTRTVFDSNGGILDTPGAFGNLPEGEVTMSPQMSNGVYIIDASFPLFGKVPGPLRCEVRDGIIRSITGARADEVIRMLDAVGPQAYHVAEFAIGTNDEARIVGSILEDEKVLGTCHIAMGNDMSYGGTNDVPIHMDGVIMQPTIVCDDELIMKNGVLCGQ